MFVTKKHLPRRTFLKGIGVSLALPLLDSMIPARTLLAQTAAKPLARLGFVYIPHGAIMAQWTPSTEGAGFEFTPILKPLEPFRDRLNVVSGLGHRAADTTAVHSLSPTTWLSGVRPKATQGVDAYAGITADQVAAQQIGQDTVLPSMELATEDHSGLILRRELDRRQQGVLTNSLRRNLIGGHAGEGIETLSRFRADPAQPCRRTQRVHCGGIRSAMPETAHDIQTIPEGLERLQDR